MMSMETQYTLGASRDRRTWDAIHGATGRAVVMRRAAIRGERPLSQALGPVIGLDHPAIIPVIDAGTTNRDGWVVWPAVDGEPLTALLGTAQQPARVVDITRQLARILADAHGRAVVHGALHPGCIMLQQIMGRADYVRLAELGLAPLGLGSPAGPWTAPEVSGGGQPDPRSDLYALGLISRALLAGVGPQAAAGAPLPGVPSALVEVLDAMVRRSPAQRPPSAVAILAPLERALSGSTAPGQRAMADTLLGLPDSRSAQPSRAAEPPKVFKGERAELERINASTPTRRRRGLDMDQTHDEPLEEHWPSDRRPVVAIAVAVAVVVVGVWLLFTAGEPAPEPTGDARPTATDPAAPPPGEPSPKPAAPPAAAPAAPAEVEGPEAAAPERADPVVANPEAAPAEPAAAPPDRPKRRARRGRATKKGALVRPVPDEASPMVRPLPDHPDDELLPDGPPPATPNLAPPPPPKAPKSYEKL